MNFPRFGAGCFAARVVTLCICRGMILFALTVVGQATHVENGTTFDGPGGKLYYEVIGSSKEIPLVLVNGGPGLDHLYLHTSSAWDALAQNRRVVFYDQRGNGRSSPLKEGQPCTLAGSDRRLGCTS
jgi:pimeloyl-ACP methyl ester carboxylesterase